MLKQSSQRGEIGYENNKRQTMWDWSVSKTTPLVEWEISSPNIGWTLLSSTND